MRVIDEEAVERAKLEFAKSDDTPRIVRIMFDVQRGIKKENSKYVTSAEDSESWDRLVVELERDGIPEIGDYYGS